MKATIQITDKNGNTKLLNDYTEDEQIEIRKYITQELLEAFANINRERFAKEYKEENNG
jgi:hypothetical protein